MDLVNNLGPKRVSVFGFRAAEQFWQRNDCNQQNFSKNFLRHLSEIAGGLGAAAQQIKMTMALTFCQRRQWLNMLTLAVILALCLMSTAAAKEDKYQNLEIKDNELQQQTSARQYPQAPFFGGGVGGGGVGGGGLGGCPLCDSSVYSYCSYKVLYDSCCCDFPVAHLKPQQCYYSDCSLLYAKSCYEYSLIKNCCCNNPY